MRGTFRSLRNRNYRLYAAGSAVSNIGTWLQRVAQDWLVLGLTHNSGTALGITTGLQFLPFLLVAPFGGLIADRFNKRKVLQCTQTAMGLTAGALAVLNLTGVVQVWHVYLLAFLFGVASAIDNPARQAFVVEMVGKEDLPNAVGLNSASFNGARVIGPAVAGLLIVLVGTGWVILINAVTYISTIVALSRMRSSELHTPDTPPRKPGMLMDGVRYVRGRGDLMAVLCVVFFVGCFGLNFQMTSALMATEVFGKGAGEYGILGSCVAVGAVIGALRAARSARPRLRVVLVAAVAFAILETVNGLMPTYGSFAALLPFLGFAQLTMITSANAMMQLSVSPEMRGRVIALYSMVFIGSTPIGSPIMGWVGQTFGARWTLIGGGLMSLFGALVAGYVFSRRRGLVLQVRWRPRPHLHVRDTRKPFVTMPAVVSLPLDAAGPEGAGEIEAVSVAPPAADSAGAVPVAAGVGAPGRETVSVLERERRTAAVDADGPNPRLDQGGDPDLEDLEGVEEARTTGTGAEREGAGAGGDQPKDADVVAEVSLAHPKSDSDEKVSAWSSSATSHASKSTPHDALPSRKKASTRRSRRAQAGR